LILRKAIENTAKRFKAARLYFGHGTDNARDEAAFLVIRGLGLPFDSDLDQEVDERKMEHLVQRRIRERVPAAYLLREAWLDGIRFYVDERVIVPRSHIAFLLKDLDSPQRVLDLCTGSGCLAVLAAKAFPRARITASDISQAALDVAAKNIARYRLQRRVRLLRADLFDGVAGRFDVILANPPYVTAASMRKLPPEYHHEPRVALAGGRDGLLLVKKIIRKAESRLHIGGVLVCEVGDGRRALQRALPSAPFIWPLQSVFLLQRN
jgi:ribosomal protein L3 glutamine methyltransferase